MEVYTRSRTSRYVIDEDFVPKATVDGEPHEMMTLVAGVSGIIAAFIILAILMVFIGCKQSERSLKKSLSTTSSESSASAESSVTSTTTTTDENLENGTIKFNRLHPNYPLVLQNFNYEKKSEVSKNTVSFIVPQILDYSSLPTLGKSNKAFQHNDNDDINLKIDSLNLSNEVQRTVPVVIIEKY